MIDLLDFPALCVPRGVTATPEHVRLHQHLLNRLHDQGYALWANRQRSVERTSLSWVQDAKVVNLADSQLNSRGPNGYLSRDPVSLSSRGSEPRCCSG